MGFGNFSVFDALSRKMGWLSQRQGVLAENIANADTPGYKPMDVEEAPFQRALARAMRASNWIRKSRPNTTRPRPRSSATSCP